MSQKKELNSEVSLLPFISLLAVMICTLLLTAIWVQIGSMNVKQAIGGQSESKAKPVLWAIVQKDQSLRLKLQNEPKSLAIFNDRSLPHLSGKVNVELLKEVLQVVKQKDPNFRTALVQPHAKTVYDDVVQIMDVMKTSGFVDLGVAPL